MLVKSRSSADLPYSEVTPEPIYKSRRDFMKAAVIGAAGAAVEIDGHVSQPRRCVDDRYRHVGERLAAAAGRLLGQRRERHERHDAHHRGDRGQCQNSLEQPCHLASFHSTWQRSASPLPLPMVH